MKFFEDGRRSSESHHSTLVELDYVEGSWLVSPGGTRTTSTSRKQPGAQQCTRVCRRTALERFVAGTTTQGLMALFHEMWSLTCTSARDVLSWFTERLTNHTGQDLVTIVAQTGSKFSVIAVQLLIVRWYRTPLRVYPGIYQ